MDLLTNYGLKIYDKLLNFNSTTPIDIAELIYLINSGKLFKKIKVDKKYINSVKTYITNETFPPFLINISYNSSYLNYMISKTKLNNKSKCILHFMAYLDNRFKAQSNMFNFAVIPNIIVDNYLIFNGNCHLWAYLLMKYHYDRHFSIINNYQRAFIMFWIVMKYKYYEEPFCIDLFKKLIKGYKVKYIKDLSEIENKIGILIMSKIKLKNLDDDVLYHQNGIHSVYFNTNVIFETNFYQVIRLSELNKEEMKKKFCYFIEINGKYNYYENNYENIKLNSKINILNLKKVNELNDNKKYFAVKNCDLKNNLKVVEIIKNIYYLE